MADPRSIAEAIEDERSMLDLDAPYGRELEEDVFELLGVGR